MMMRYAVVALMCWLSLDVCGQDDWQETLRQWMTVEDMEESYGEDVWEQLAEQAATPVNLNQVTREELEALPFLTALQVEQIMEYVYRYAPVRSLSELMMISSLDWHTRRLLEHFVYVGHQPPQRVWPTFDQVAQYGRHTIMLNGKIPLYSRRGDYSTDSTGYRGYKYKHDIRYQFNYHNRIKFGLTAAQDAGEPFFSDRNRMGYDHYSYYFQLRHMGRLEALNLGMFRVQMGMGLVMNTTFSLGKLATLQSLGRTTQALTAHASRSQGDYLQGAAATVRISRNLHLTAFASYRALDATLNNNGTVRTLLHNGYHRTLTELSKKNNTHETDLGGSFGYRKGTLHANLNMVYTHFDRPLVPQNTLYRRYAPSGSDFTNASIDYGYNNSRWGLAGELAVNGQGAVAAINTLNWRTSEKLTLMLLHRYYDKRYTALHAQSFGENSSVQIEHGVFLGARWQPSRAWLFQGYADYAHFSWPRYQVSNISDAFDALLSARFSQQSWGVEGRYRMRIRQKDNALAKQLENQPHHQLRLRFSVTPAPQLSLQTQADGVRTCTDRVWQNGIMLSQHASWQWHWLKADAHVGWFHSDSYDARLYQYEPSVLYDFSFPAYSGHGLRHAVMLRANIGNRLVATAKYGTTKYFDRSTIGSGLQQVNHSSLTDIQLQLRYTL